MIPNLIFDIDLDLAWNALACNRDLRWTVFPRRPARPWASTPSTTLAGTALVSL